MTKSKMPFGGKNDTKRDINDIFVKDKTKWRQKETFPSSLVNRDTCIQRGMTLAPPTPFILRKATLFRGD